MEGMAGRWRAGPWFQRQEDKAEMEQRPLGLCALPLPERVPLRSLT